MKKLLLFIILITYIHTFAQSVNKQNVVNYAKLWLKNHNQNMQVSDVETIKTQNEIVLYLVHLNPKGFIIFSADKRVIPILAYSFENDFIYNDNISPEVRYLIDEYSNQILLIKHNRFINLPDLWQTQVQSRVFTQNSVNPLLNSNWGQGSGYNQYCPSDSNGPGGHVWAGCVATAGAQILNYWQQPTHGYGEYSYIDDTYGLQSVVYENVNYDWTGMQNGDIQAIALLIYHVAVGVNMDFGVNASSAYTSDLVSAFHNIYEYDAEMTRRQDYSTNDWINIIKTELNNNRPIVYIGRSQSNGGHAWVCDGYDNNDLFHMNWGWGGSYNGYYSLDDLTPGAYNYNSYQYIIKNIEPLQTYVCNNDENEQGNNNIGINNDNFREGAYLDENFNSITACLSPGDKDWYTVVYQYNSETEYIDILVEGANANTTGPYNISMNKNGNILTIETHPMGRYTDTVIQWKCMCDNGNLPVLMLEDDNSGANGMYSKLVIDLDQIDRTYVPDSHFMFRLFDIQVASTTLQHYIFTAYAQNFTVLQINYSNIDDLTGIEAFSNLEELWCQHNNLTSMDISQNHNLQKVYLDYNNLQSINMNGIDTSNLSEFSVYGNNNLYCISLDDYINANMGTGIYANWNLVNSVTFSRNDCNQQTFVPDDYFEHGLIAWGYDRAVDNYVPTSNVNIINTLDLGAWNISDVTGINDFTQLHSLSLNNNNIANIDVSGLTQLENLNLSNNSLNTIDLGTNQFLNNLNISHNNLTNIDITNNHQITNLDVSNNQLTSIDISTNTLLQNFKISNNQVSVLDLSNNNQILELYCDNNQLTQIDLSNQPNLTFLNIEGNNIIDLDINNNQTLNNLNISNNQLTSIDISNNTALQYLNISNNQIGQLDTSNNLLLSDLNCSINQIQAIDLSNNTSLTDINASNNLLTDFNLQNGHNSIINNFYAQNNPNLTCIFVDDANYSTQNWTNIDANTHFVETQAECDAFLGVVEEILTNIKIYPNPTQDILYIKNSDNKKIKKVNIYNLLGQLIMQTEKNLNPINVSDLPQGMYLLELELKQGTKAKFKFIKE